MVNPSQAKIQNNRQNFEEALNSETDKCNESIYQNSVLVEMSKIIIEEKVAEQEEKLAKVQRQVDKVAEQDKL